MVLDTPAQAQRRDGSAISAAALALLLLTAAARADETPAPAARGNDFPTVERVLFVESCARDWPDRPRTEMLYKCSCVIDVMAAELSFEDALKAYDAQKKANAWDYVALERKFKAAVDEDPNLAEADYNLGVLAERQGIAAA